MMKSFLSTKNTIFSQISLKNSKFISDHFNLSKQFNTLFEDVGRSLNINKDNSDLSDLENASVPIEIAIEMFEKHLSVLDIKQNISIEKKFNFSSTDICDIDKETTARK